MSNSDEINTRAIGPSFPDSAWERDAREAPPRRAESSEDAGSLDTGRRGGASRQCVPRQSLGTSVAFSFALLFLFEQAADAATFPRGPGFYFSPYKMVALFAVFLGWVGTCNWLNRDAPTANIESTRWNVLLLAVGVLGFLVLWIFPSFWFGLVLFIFLNACAIGWYATVRNQNVEDEEKIFTEAHLRGLVTRYFKIDMESSDDEEDEGGPAKKKAKNDVRFVGRGADQREENPDLVRKARGSKGYTGAQEMVYDAVTARATDIHMEPSKTELMVRFRVDGILVNQHPFSRAMGDAVLNIFKVLGNMDITEKRKPQDGSFSAEVDGKHIDFRAASAGSVIGEKMVLRLLDQKAQIAGLDHIGMREKTREQVRTLVRQPHGLFLVCGPTGSGKSTTLYGCLNEIDRFQQNIITLENPVEYQVENVTQIEINPKAGKTFASELRSILRQDPNVIMIGEIRDQETAEIACQAAQTGHMVFSTVHANDTVTAVGRLIDLGVAPFLISSALSGVLGQRLLRLLCPDCKVRYKPNPEVLQKANLPADKIKFLYRPPDEKDKAGNVCAKCGGTGYFKRTGIFELLIVTEKIRDAIRENPNLSAIRQEAVKEGMRFLYEDGLRQVLEGRSSIQELMRVSK